MKYIKIKNHIKQITFFIFRELLFIVLPIIILLLVKCIILKQPILTVLALPNFSFAIVVLFSLATSKYIKYAINLKIAKSKLFSGAVNFYFLLLIASVIFLIISILNESEIFDLSINNSTLVYINIGALITGGFSLYLSEITESEYYNDLYDENKESDPIDVFDLSIEKLKNINSKIHDVIHLMANSKMESLSDEEIKHNWYSYKGKEMVEVSRTIVQELKANLKVLEGELEEKSKNIEKEACSQQSAKRP